MKGFIIDFRGKYENLEFTTKKDAIYKLLELYDEDLELRAEINAILDEKYLMEVYLEDRVDEQYELAGELADFRYEENISKKLLEEK